MSRKGVTGRGLAALFFQPAVLSRMMSPQESFGNSALPRSGSRTVLSHFGEISLPEVLAGIRPNILDTLGAHCILQRSVHGCRVSLLAKHTRGLLEELLI